MLVVVSLALGVALDAGASQDIHVPKTIFYMYERMASDILAGKPLVITVYVTLCDNETTVWTKVPNEKICSGDKLGSNIYWSTSGGLKKYLDSAGWERISYEKDLDENLAARGVWRKKHEPGGKLEAMGVKFPFDVVIVGLAYRGSAFKESLAGYLGAVHGDKASIMKVAPYGKLFYGGRSHVVGYIGHDYFMNVDHYDELMSHAKGGSKLHKGVFALSCSGKDWIQPAVERKNTHILLMNKYTTYPGAWAVGGLIEGIAMGKEGSGIHHQAALAFSEGKNRPLQAVLNAFSYGD